MRINDEQRKIILSEVHQAFGPHARVRLFGSRVDDSAIGGDIDLLVELEKKHSLRVEISLVAQLEGRLNKPVDMITTWPTRKAQPIVEIAKLTGIEL